MICPSCGRETPTRATCAQCGATLAAARRLPLGFLKWAALLLALLGTIAMLISAGRLAVPQVKIGELTALNNLAYAQVSGAIISTPRYDPQTSFISFHLGDGTGEIAVNIYRAETQALLANALIPQLGDHITLEGAIRLRADSLSLTLAAPENVRLEHPAPIEQRIGAISNQAEQSLVVVRGQILDRRDPYPGLIVLTLMDATGQIEAVIPADVVALTGPAPTLQVGDFLEFAGIVTLYRNTPQLTLTTSPALRKLDSLPEPLPTVTPLPRPTLPDSPTPINQITLAQVGQTLRVAGEITRSESFSRGQRLTLTDGTGEIIVLLWQAVFDSLPDKAQLQVGARAQVVGEIEVFAGQLEIVPAEAEGVTVEGS